MEYNDIVMEINVRNLAKIKDAHVKIDGITVIAGNNNTGKSTIGKALFTSFYTLKNLDAKIKDYRVSSIYNTIVNSLQPFERKSEIKYTSAFRPLQKTRNIAEEIVKFFESDQPSKAFISNEVFFNFLDKSSFLEFFENEEDRDETIKSILKRINDVLSIDDETFIKEIMTGNFIAAFDFQINSLIKDAQKDAGVELIIKNKKISFSFNNNECVEFSSDFDIQHNAIYIDDPFIIDEAVSTNSNSFVRNVLLDLIDSIDRKKVNPADSILAKEKLKEIQDIINSVVTGEIERNAAGELTIKDDKYVSPINVINLSAGLKPFVILKLFLEKAIISEKDVLILDEPEVHLHPDWQLLYAQLIVLLQKKFDLSIVLTTHSPYFLDAVNLYSCKYGIKEKCNYYLTREESGSVVLDDVSSDIDKIYQKMASPINALETLRHELNNSDL